MRIKSVKVGYSLILGLWSLVIAVSLSAQDMPLSMVLSDDTKWEQLAEGYQFTDASTSDAEGNVYFTDVAKGTTINRINLDGKVSTYLENMPRISGLKWAPDGRLCAATQAPAKQIIAIDVNGKITVLLENAEPNDLVVTHKGGIYFTQTGKSQVMFIPPKGQVRVVDQGIKQPNGLTLSPDQGTLVVSDFGGTNLWAFRIDANGSLSCKSPYMTVRAAVGKAASSGDGMTTDSAGRYYVATEVGLQMFDPTGRLCGVIAKPQNKFLANLTFGGPELSYLYVVCSDKVYRRKTKTHGLVFFKEPPRP
jgi:gluconolactonase